MAVTVAALQSLLNRVGSLRVGVIGDFCLDAYWHADMRRSELSRETPHFPLPIVEERMQPGAAGNVACNMAALKPARVTAMTVLGQDWRGMALMALLTQAGVDTGGMVQSKEWVTNGYIKPMRHGISETVYEDPRLDFENTKELPDACEDALLAVLEKAALEMDLLYVCDQLRFGCITPKVRQKIEALGAEGLTVFVDSRDRISLYTNVIGKPNEIELCRAAGVAESESENVLLDCAGKLQAQTKRPLLVTLGSKGCMVLEKGEVAFVPAYAVPPPVDICGAGDTFGAAAALLHTAGAPLAEAAAFAVYSASLTVQKIAETGVTTRAELLQRTAEAQA